MNIDSLKLFFAPAYFFNPYPGYDMKFINIFVIFFGIILLASFILWLIIKNKKKNKPLIVLLGSFANLFAWSGFFGELLIFFRYEGIPYFSSRAILFLFLLILILWTLYLLIFGIKKYKKTLQEFKNKKEKEKYFRKR